MRKSSIPCAPPISSSSTSSSNCICQSSQNLQIKYKKKISFYFLHNFLDTFVTWEQPCSIPCLSMISFVVLLCFPSSNDQEMMRLLLHSLSLFPTPNTHTHTHWIREGQFKKLIFLCWQLFFACLNLIWLNFVFKFTLVALFVSCIANLRFLVVVFFFSLSLSCPLFSSVSVHRFHSTLARVFIFLDDFYRLKECHFWGITEENSASLFRCNKHSHFFCQFAPIDYQDHAFDGICWHPNCSKVKLGMRLCSTRNVTSCTKPLRNFVFNWIPLG